MIVFVNERSLEEHSDWGAALRLFWEASVALTGHAGRFRDSSFFGGAAFKARFESTLAGATPEIRAAIRQVAFSNRYWQCWRADQVSLADEMFVCESPEVLMNDESLCEAAERKLQMEGEAICIVSAPQSSFANKPHLNCVKHSTQARAELRNADILATVLSWIADERGYYDPESRVAPSDFQTILVKDQERFSRTNRVWHVAGKDRRIYKEAATGNYYYVDEGHPGHSAHLEVFDTNGNHLGEANIATGVVDGQKRDPSKTIKL